MNKKQIIKNIKNRIDTWKNCRKNILEDSYKNYLHGRHIDYSICDIVIQELLDLLKDIEGEKSE